MNGFFAGGHVMPKGGGVLRAQVTRGERDHISGRVPSRLYRGTSLIRKRLPLGP